MSNFLRLAVSRMQHGLRFQSTQILSLIVYLPLARLAWAVEKFGIDVTNFPLSSYRNMSFYTMRTDALDRFGTRLEQRFSREHVRKMMENAGLERVVFSENEPFWWAVGCRR